MDVDQLEIVSVDLKEISDVVDNNIKKTVHDQVVTSADG